MDWKFLKSNLNNFFWNFNIIYSEFNKSLKILIKKIVINNFSQL